MYCHHYRLAHRFLQRCPLFRVSSLERFHCILHVCHINSRHECVHNCVQAFQQFIEPTMQYADIVVPRGGQNRVAVQLIVEHVKDQLKQVHRKCTIL